MGEAHTILIVEDEEILQDILCELLSTFGYACTRVSSCAEAREALERETFDCALIDLGLPDGAGVGILPDIKAVSPQTIPIILTGDARSETVVETMRAGAFDYLMKPVGAAQLKASVSRAIEHHDAVCERDRLVLLLAEEKKLLKAKVGDATIDIREHAGRLHSLIRLTEVSEEFYTDETLFRRVFEELEKYVPVSCLALSSATQEEFLAVYQQNDQVHFISEGDIENEADVPSSKTVCLDLSPQGLVKHFTGLELDSLSFRECAQSSWGNATCSVSFLLDREFLVDGACDEFLGMCAHFIGSEWIESRLLLHATRQASLGNIALELSNGVVQGLTAIRTATDVVSETELSADALEGLGIIVENVEGLQRQIQEFRQLSSHRKDLLETVCLDRFVEQALTMLSMTIRSRDIKIKKDYEGTFECILLNGAALARTFLDLVSSAVRTVEAGGQVLLRLSDTGENLVTFDVVHDAPRSAEGTSTGHDKLVQPWGALENHPRFILVQRTIRSCGGKLVSKHKRQGRFAYQVLLPKNAASAVDYPEVTWG